MNPSSTTNTIKPSPTTNLQNNNNNNRHSENIMIWSHITSCLLQSWIENDSESDKKLLIIDSRNANDYNKLHVKNSINLPYSKIIKRRLLNDKISIVELLIKNSIADFLINNKHECNIVVYDHESEHTNQLDANESFAPILLNKLANKFKSVSFLIGGFVNFNSKYPNLCEKSEPSPYFNSNSMDISPSSAACSSSEFSSPNKDNNEDITSFIKPKLSQSLSANESTNTTTTTNPYNNDSNKKNDLFQFLSPISHSSSSSSCSSENVLREPTKILDFLYLGSQEDSLSEKTMKALNITNVLNVSIQCPKPKFIEDAHFLRIPLNDGHAAKILPFFDVAFRFIEKCRKSNSNVLIHCLAGISRSPTLAIAYLMKFKNLKSDEAYEYVKERRTTISPNFNFLGQLYEYEKMQQNEKLKQQSTEQVTVTAATEVTTSSPIVNTTLPFLKFAKKQQSAMNLIEAANYQYQMMNESSSSSSSKYSPPKTLRKKFIFQFNNLESNSNENIMSPHQQQQQQFQKNSLLLNPVIGQSLLNNALQLPSPSQAFSNFNLNSPSTTSANKTILSSFEQEFQQNHHQQQQTNTSMCKSFTMNNINDVGRVVMRRPNNLQMPPFFGNDKVNLKRPSSILLESNNNIGASSAVVTSSPASNLNDFNNFVKNQTNLSPCISTDNNNNSNNNSSKTATKITTGISPSLINKNASSITSSSCSSTASSSSSSASTTFMSSLICASHESNNDQQQQQQQCQKKIKLSPIQDKNILLNNLSQSSVIHNIDLSPSSSSSSFKNECKTKEDYSLSINTTVLLRSKLTNTNNVQEYKMNESKSVDAIMSLIEKNNQNENDDNLMMKINDEQLGNNVALYATTTATNVASSGSINTLMKSSSSNSSSKTGSNKNSLHGSIETMIEVS